MQFTPTVEETSQRKVRRIECLGYTKNQKFKK